MFRQLPITAAGEEALSAETARIAGLGESWRPTEENLRAVVETVFAAEFAVQRESQKRGMKEAQERGVHVGRPRKLRPKCYPHVKELWLRGAVSARKAAKCCGVSAETFRKWTEEDAEKQTRRA